MSNWLKNRMKDPRQAMNTIGMLCFSGGFIGFVMVVVGVALSR